MEYSDLANPATEQFDAVLAEMDDMGRADLVEGGLVREWRTRLAAAHAAEVGALDEELALAKLTATAEAEYANKMRARAEAAERDARRLREVVSKCNAHIVSKQRIDQHNPYTARELHPELFAAIDACMGEKGNG